MSRKEGKAAARSPVRKPVVEAGKSDRWTVRGVPSRLQKAAAEAAWASDLTMGAWLSRLVENAVAHDLPPSEPTTIQRFEAIERRLERLERGQSGQPGERPEARLAS